MATGLRGGEPAGSPNMSSIGERAGELTIEYLTGSISEPHMRELESLLREHEEARIAFLNETHFDSQLGMLLVDSRAESQVSEGVEEPADVARGRLRVARPKAIERPSERGMSFPGFARRMIPFAVAAAMLAIVGVYFLFTQAGPCGRQDKAGGGGKHRYAHEMGIDTRRGEICEESAPAFESGQGEQGQDGTESLDESGQGEQGQAYPSRMMSTPFRIKGYAGKSRVDRAKADFHRKWLSALGRQQS